MKNEHTESKYEASYYVKSSLKNSFGETCFMNLQFLVRIDYKDENDIVLYGTGSGGGYTNFR